MARGDKARILSLLAEVISRAISAGHLTEEEAIAMIKKSK